MAVDHPHFGTFCEICFEQVTPETCVVDADGAKWDICPGACAVQAGIRERGVSVEEFEMAQARLRAAARRARFTRDLGPQIAHNIEEQLSD